MNSDNAYHRLLLISHNAYDESTNIGKTLISLLGNWNNSNLYQIYLREEIPEKQFCNSYFKISDFDIIKSLFHKMNWNDAIIQSSEQRISNQFKNKIYKFGNKRLPIVSLFRDKLWDLGVWKTKILRQWLMEISPEIILFIPNDYCLAYEVTLWVARLLKIPIITFFMDDSFYFDFKNFGIEFLRRKRLRKLCNELIRNKSVFLTISPQMADSYKTYLNIDSTVLANSLRPSEFQLGSTTSHNEASLIFGYFGNLHSGRLEPLIRIGVVLDKLNAKYGTSHSLKIYTKTELNIFQIAILRKINSLILSGYCKPEEVRRYHNLVDILVHVESFSIKNIKSVYLSLSTKIPEYLASGKVIFVFGPKDVASVEYIEKNKLGYVCNHKNELFSKILQMIQNCQDWEKQIANANDFANIYHQIDNNQRILSEIINIQLGKIE